MLPYQSRLPLFIRETQTEFPLFRIIPAVVHVFHDNAVQPFPEGDPSDAVRIRLEVPAVLLVGINKGSVDPDFDLSATAGIENKIRSTGWVSPNWSLSAELAPFMQSLTGTMLEPLIVSYLSKVPDEALPEMAHTLVDQAIANGGITLFDGNVSFDKSDMEELKRLLEFNLPIQRKEHYEVKQPPKTN